MRKASNSSPQPFSSSCPWLLASLCADRAEEPGFDLDEFLRRREILLEDVPFIGRNRHRKSYGLVIHRSSLASLVAKLPEFAIKEECNPALPTDSEVFVYGSIEARRRAQADLFDNAVDAIQSSWGSGPQQCYREIVRANGLAAKLERWILNRDVLVGIQTTSSLESFPADSFQEADISIQMRLAQNALFLCLTVIDVGSTEASRLLQRPLDVWLRPFQNHGEGLHNRNQAEVSQDNQVEQLRERRLRLELQEVTLLRMLFEFSGGKPMLQQRNFPELGSTDFTICRNARLCCSAFDVTYSKPPDRWNSKAIHMALSKSRIFTPSSEKTTFVTVPELKGWSSRMMKLVLGLPDCCLVWRSRTQRQQKIMKIRVFHHSYCARWVYGNSSLPLFICQLFGEIALAPC